MGVGYADLGDGEYRALDDLPEYQFPVWCSAQCYQVLLVLGREGSTEEFARSDVLVVQVGVWDDHLLLEVLENGYLCSLTSFQHRNVSGRLPRRDYNSINLVHPR